MKQVIGKCSCCGGRVVLPTAWLSVIPPVPTCESCGATQSSGPVIQMEPRRMRTIQRSPHPDRCIGYWRRRGVGVVTDLSQAPALREARPLPDADGAAVGVAGRDGRGDGVRRRERQQGLGAAP